MPLVSIVIPAYNIRDDLPRAVASICAQTLTDFELFLVDDGSTDGTAQVVDDLAAGDPRIIAMHQPNGGAPAARNAAIVRATGTYCYFCDGDDYAEPGMLQTMVQAAQANDAQMVVTSYFIKTYDRKDRFYHQQQNCPSDVCATKEAFRARSIELFDNNLLYTPWNKLFLRQYLVDNDIRFPATFWDDFPFVLHVVRDIERVVLMDQPFYHYIRRRAEAETAKYRPDMLDKREEENGWMLDLYRVWDMDTPQVREFLARRYIERVVGCLENIVNPNNPATAKERRAQAKALVGSDNVRQALRVAKPRSLYTRVMLWPVRWRWAWACLLECRVIGWVKRRHTLLFAKLKAGR